MREETHPAAAVFGGDGNAEQPHVAELLPQVGREQVVAVDLVGARRDFLLGEGVHAFAQQVDIFTELERLHSISPRRQSGKWRSIVPHSRRRTTFLVSPGPSAAA